MSKGTCARAIGLFRLGQDHKVIKVGKAEMLEARVASTSGYGDREATSWFTLKVFGDRRIEILDKRLKKGSRVHVDGELTVREWNTNDGEKRQSTEITVGYDGTIEMVDNLKGDDERREQRQDDSQRRRQPAQYTDDDLDDDVPF